MISYAKNILSKRVSPRVIYYVSPGLLSIVAGLFFYHKFNYIEKATSLFRYRLFLALIVIICSYALLLLVGYLFKKKIKIEKIFLILAIPIGFVYMLAVPVGRAPDEPNHFARAYGISRGDFISEVDENGDGGSYFGNRVMESIYWQKDLTYRQYLGNFRKKASGSDSDVFNYYTNTSQYPPFAYLPQAIGIFVASLFDLPILVIALFGRLSNYAVWVLLVFFSIKVCPFRKRSILFVAFLPMIMQESVSLSADPLVNGCALLLVSLVLRYRFGGVKVFKWHDYITLVVLSLFVSTCKMVYFPICLVLLMIPSQCFSSKRKKLVFVLLSVIGTFAATCIWLLVAFRYKLRADEGVDSMGQILTIVKNPFYFISVLSFTVIDKSYDYLSNLVCGTLGWFDISTCSFCSVSLIIVLFWILIGDNTKRTIEIIDKRLLSFSAFTVVLLIFTAEYLAWTPVADRSVSGVQGRYFVPVLLPIFVICNSNKKLLGFKKKFHSAFMLEIMMNVLAVICVFFAHV